jgi:hypothetical protein
MIASPYDLVVFIISHKNSVVVNAIYDYDFMVFTIVEHFQQSKFYFKI